MPLSDSHARQIRDRFTRTAEQFGKFSLSTRSAEAAQLLSLALPHLPAADSAHALDVACGPGTFTLAFASHVAHITGLDFTPALLAVARSAASKDSVSNLSLVCADAVALPHSGASFDVVTCAYALHHLADPACALAEMFRVLRSGGILALVDLIVPEDPQQAAAANAIERARDPSHSRTLPASEILSRASAAGFRILASEPGSRIRSFDDWMQIAGHALGDTAYVATRRLMLASSPADSAGFHPRLLDSSSSLELPDIEWVQTSFFLITRRD